MLSVGTTVSCWTSGRQQQLISSCHQRLLNHIYVRLAMSPPILYLVTTRSSAMVCSCSSSDMLAVKYRSLLSPAQRQVPSARVRAPAANTGLTLSSTPRPPHGDAADVTTTQPRPAKMQPRYL